MATPGVGPSGLPYSIPLGYQLQPTDAILSIDRERMSILVKQFQGRIGVLYSERSPFFKQLANGIVGHYKTSLYFSAAEPINYDDSRWLELADPFSHLIFVGVPQSKKRRARGKSQPMSLDSSSREDELMSRNHRKLSSVVVLDLNMPRSRAEKQSRPSHFLDRFLHISMQNDPVWLAQAAFAVFAAPTPIASPDDSAFWSSSPKLVDVWKDYNSLGLSIMTREMAHESPFSRIVLIKGFNEDCLSELKRRLGKYTHIQFMNGVFLDGLSIEKVTEIFRIAQHNRIQLLVRYIHPSRPKPILQALPSRLSMYQPSKAVKPRKASVNGREALPMPLFILGDNYTLQRELFHLLQTEEALGNSLSLHSPGTHSEASTPSIFSPSPTAPARSLSTPFVSLPENLLQVKRGSTGSVDTVPSLNVTEKGIKRMRKPSSSLPFEFTESDEYVERAEVPSGRFKIDAQFLPDFDKTDDSSQSQMDPPTIRRSLSTHPEIASPQYVLHMLKKSVDRNLTHLFLKPNGIYLIVIGLEDIAADPLIQYDNLFYWLRLIHSHVEPAEIRRIIVVGMYRKSELQGEESQIIQCVQHLNTAIREQMKQNYSLPIKEGGNVFIYDLDAPNDLLYLCACIQMCVEVFIDQAWYFQKPFFERVFMPFESYRRVCAEVIKHSRSKVVMGKHRVERFYQYKATLPERFWETLQIYSSAMCSEKSSDCLLQCSFIVKLLNVCTEMNHHDRQVFSVRHPSLTSLPIIRAQLLNHRMAREMHITEQSHHNTVIEWMKNLEVVYSLGKFGADRDTFFIPYLATHSLSDNALYKWNDAVAEEFNEASVVLYAKLSIPATQQFFYRLIASLLTDILQNPSQSPHCFINLGCTEAICPLNSRDQQQSVVAYPTLFRYHSIQNIIEFRTTTNRPLAILHAVEEKLKDVYSQSRYSSNPEAFTGSVAFYIPATEFDKTIKDSALWKLGNVGRQSTATTLRGLLDDGSEEGGEEEVEEEPKDEEEEEEDELQYDGPEKLLLPLKFLTDPGKRDTNELKAWASSAPEMKTLPGEIFLRASKALGSSEDYWPMVATKLNLLQTLDINYLRENPAKGGNGSEVLKKWEESSLTYRDLVNALNEVGLNVVADIIQNHYERQGIRQ